ncbi:MULTISPECIES: nucleoid-associated protein [Acinetobacter calcoaceticus/baumannii complex]|uniref:Nucleoid-associated protein n=2 Tax=Acinetobacter calcoaceticus/baumannii complex TaxID=909768 RepID=A0AB36M3Q5_ACINO|nr:MULTISPECIES: nucleoid-associated protein [Acinetobacter calcoaceticus/baumannii complex]KCZ31410.1 37-kD nucleoid-associated bacterial family protein [Acinetobacter baumannii 25977_9]EXB68274.1 37-kD nucleoid-associated bacterial family protein [Acinetobacter sp. 21871]EXR63303.1 37-kD nucleoid-associated bacterial family protein [Acinetobacter sp. 1424608]EXT38410.1 37-kD nucleoid-associated bacterial family protein [Acinetobacter sp. 25977_8]EXT44395.1 37-kD nucleoid-associated bacterial
MKLTHFIIHEIDKKNDKQDPSDLQPKLILDSDQEFPLDKSASITFSTGLRKKYTNSISGYGCIDKSENSIFQLQLQEYRDGKIDFIKLSKLLVERLMTSLAEGQQLKWATGGLIVFLEYLEDDRTYLLISMIKEKKAITFDRANLNLEEFLSIDLDKLHEGARIDLKKWEEDKQPYVSFIKKSSTNVSDYFKDSINCVNYTDSKVYTDAVFEALKEYAPTQSWNTETVKEKKEILKQHLIDAVNKNTKNGEPVVYLKEISVLLNQEEPDSFYNFLREESFEVSDSFQPDRGTVRRWMRVTVKTGTINVTFNVADFEQGNIVLSPEGNFIITNVSEKAKEEFNKAINQ